MFTKVKSQKEILLLVNKLFGKAKSFQVEVTDEEIIIRKDEDVVEKTRGTIKNLDLKTVKLIAESEEFCGY